MYFDGRLDDRPPAHLRSDAELVLEAYEQFGDRFAEHLNGDFAVAVLDAGRRTLLLARDVMAARCLYYCALPGVVLFSTDIKSILADPRVSARLDEDALADLLLNNWSDDHRTCFKGIHSVPPGEVVVAASAGITRRVHWAFDPSKRIRYRSFDEYVDHFRLLFEQSVRRRLRSNAPVAVAVGGGVDSSAIFSQAATLVRREASRAQVYGISMTFAPGTPADEQAFLNEIERAYDTRIVRVPVTQMDYLTGAENAVRDLELPNLIPSSQRAIYEEAQKAGSRVLLHGFFADQMLSDMSYLVDFARRGRWLRIRHDVREFAAWSSDVEPGVIPGELRVLLRRLLPPAWLHKIAKQCTALWRRDTGFSQVFTAAFRARAYAQDWRRSLRAGGFRTAHAEQFFRHLTAGHYVHSVRLESGVGMMYGVDVRYPFRDRDLVAFLMSIPGEVINWQGVPKGLLRHALSGVLPDAIRDRRWKADFTELTRLPPAKLSKDSRAVRAGFVDHTVLDAIDGVPDQWQFPDPLGLELFLEIFFGGEVPAGA